MQKALFQSKKNDWTTPISIIKCIQKLFKYIDLDPCADINLSVPAKKHYTENEDGLSKSWYGRVYMNPPYGRSIKKWIEKIKTEYESNNIIEGLALVPSRTDTKWFRLLKNYPRCFVDGRLKFGDGVSPAPFPCCMFYLGKNIDQFTNIFSTFGNVYILYKNRKICKNCGIKFTSERSTRIYCDGACKQSNYRKRKNDR